MLRRYDFINLCLENERSALATVTGIVKNSINAVQTSKKLDDKSELSTSSRVARSLIVLTF